MPQHMVLKGFWLGFAWGVSCTLSFFARFFSVGHECLNSLDVAPADPLTVTAKTIPPLSAPKKIRDSRP